VTAAPTDAELVRRVLSGEVDAYAGLVARYRDRFGRFATQMLGNREDAEEALQDSFIRGYKALARCEDPERFGSWLFRILVNRCRTHGAKRARRERTIVLDEIALQGAGVDGGTDAAAWREVIEWALAKLDEGQREAFLLKHVEELSYEEMADMTGVGISALKMRVKRACDRLRVMLQEVERV
jgi:RNA polymerase sigma-70 factor, ECF subfamily